MSDTVHVLCPFCKNFKCTINRVGKLAYRPKDSCFNYCTSCCMLQCAKPDDLLQQCPRILQMNKIEKIIFGHYAKNNVNIFGEKVKRVWI